MRLPRLDLFGVVGFLLTAEVWVHTAIFPVRDSWLPVFYGQLLLGAALGAVATRRHSKWWLTSVVLSLLTIGLLVIMVVEPFA